ncbi:hypothetical protein SASPL_143008 [Salvia splendens]|uniref:Integrase catalytic domain-containing protein n=1 Tax=Salvia splendens TaxID=180675 RepID=A0A8X8Z9L3_SALSN|nr:hypothetical protein SASPL_143008 [Salvia splendens]
MGESSNFAQPSIPKFDGDYDHWSLLMENLLRSKEYFDVVKDGVEEPVNEEVLTEAQKKTLADARLKDLKAKNYLFSAIDKSILKTITLKETSKQLWDSMKTKCSKSLMNIEVAEAEEEGLAKEEEEIDEEEGDVLLMAYTPIQEEKEEAWFLDSGCSNHMSGDKSWFSKLDEDFRCSVKLGNNSRLSVIGKGDVNLCVNGRSHIISDVYLIPELTSNLVSLGQFVQKGCEILMHHGVCKLYHPDLGLIMQSRMTANRLFKIMATKYSMVATEECLKTTTMDDLQLWHRRYGHLNYKGLRTLKYQNMVRGIPHLNTEGAEKCVSCLVGKQHRESIPKKSLWRSSRRLQLVHSDICGPISPTSNSDKRYILTFIDDFSRKVKIYFLSLKSEAFVFFTRFKNQVEKEIGETLACLRTDRGGEFTSNEFNDFCEEAGVSRQLTTAFTPQQNGIAERKNRTIMNMVQCILNDKGVPRKFWAEAAKWAVHVLNRSPTSVIQGKTPEEIWSGMKPRVDYFRVFGCIAHVHVPDQRRTKLDDKSTICVLIGVSNESKSYRLYNPTTEKVITSRDVIFEEEKGWDWGQKIKESEAEQLVWEDRESEVEKNMEEAVQEPKTEQNNEEGVQDTVPIPIQTPTAQRIRRNPAYLLDYETGGEEEEEEEIAGLVMFVSNDDPVTFDKASKEDKWILERFKLQNGNEVKNPIVPGVKLSKEGDGNRVDCTLYKQLIGSLMYITTTRPDLMFAVCLLSRYMADPRDEHMQAAKRVLRYIKGTLGFGVFYKRGMTEELTVYTDSDYAGDVDNRRSTSGYAFLLSGGAVAWASKKQPVVTLSTTEAEFIAAAYCACQCVWMRRILEEFGLMQSGCTTILCDNNSTIKLSRNPILHGRSKHIDVRFHFLRDLTKNEVVKLVHCGTNDQIADILTKPLKLEAFVRLREKLGVCERVN